MNTLENVIAYQNKVREVFGIESNCDVRSTFIEMGEKYAYTLDYTEDRKLQVNHAVFVDGVVIEFKALNPSIWEEVNI